jgi:hypothetical protein
MKKTIKQRISNLISTNAQHFFSSYTISNWNRWKELKGKYKGERVFLVANGPSLNITPLYLLKNEHVIVFNRFTLMLERLNYIPPFYMVVDGLLGPTIKEDINYFIDNCRNVFIPDITKGDLSNYSSFTKYADNVLYLYDEPIKYSKHLPFVGFGNTVIYCAFQVFQYLGFSEVVVVGNDMNYVIHKSADVIGEEQIKGRINQNLRSSRDDDPNHFDPRYFGKGKEFHQPTTELMDKIFANLDRVAIEYKKTGVNVVNAGYNSKVESFPKQDFYKCLGYSKEKIDEIFEDLVKSKGFGSRMEFLNIAMETKDFWDDNRNVAAVPIAIAGDMIKKKIFDYLPVGPYEGRIYFINRKILK